MLFIQCEDTKNKENVSFKKQTNQQIGDAESNSKTSIIPIDSVTIPKKLIKITPDNVVSFLTAYGEIHKQTKVAFTTPFGTIVIKLFKDISHGKVTFL